MKKNKKIRRLLSSFICLVGSGIGLTTMLSSCVSSSNDSENDSDSEDSVITPPSNDDNNSGDNNNNDNNNGDNGSGGDNGSNGDNPSQPETKPEVKPPTDNTPSEPTPPVNKPEQPVPPSSNLISNDSISLKNKGQLLPSQYLENINDLSNLSLDETKIEENFDKTKVGDVKYTVSLLNDWDGTLSIKMEYKNKIDNRSYEFIFYFSGLVKLNDQNYNLYFDVINKSLLNAKEISDKSINNNADARSFFTYLKEKETNLIFKNGANSIPLEYLDFSGGLTFNGFKETWYTSNNNIELNIQPKSLKINMYEKNIDSNTINLKQISYPTHLIGSNRKPIKLICSSVLDYLLEQITTNSEYKEDKFASYYYYDIVNNQSTQSQLKLANNLWLENVKNTIEGYDAKQYRPILSKTINPRIDNEGNLIIQIQMQLSDEDVSSINTKELTIKSFLTLNKDIFFYSGNKNNKFNLFCKPDKQEKIFSDIGNNRNATLIKKEIKDSNDTIVNINKYFNYADGIKFKNNIELYFGNSEILKDTYSNNYYTSDDNKISIKNYYINYNDINDMVIQYNKSANCFQLKCKITIECEGIDYNSSTSDYMSVNITKLNTPFI